MPIIACGINHQSASIELREKVVFPQEKLALYLQDLISNEQVREAVLLSTCNRSELYCYTDHPDHLFAWFQRQHAVSTQELRASWHCYTGQQAIEHMMQVACGLSSMIIGEPQILGQMKDAFSEACAAGSVGPQFNRLFQQIFAVAKEVRTHTAIGACPVSIASAVIALAKQVYTLPIHDAQILLIGAGDTIQLVLRYLQAQSFKNVMITNRNQDNAGVLAEKYNIQMMEFTKLQETLSVADIVISATASPHPIVTTTMLTTREKPLFIFDMAVPRDVEPHVNHLKNVCLYSIDDLKNIIQQNIHGREHAAEKAHEIIHHKSKEFIAWQDSLEQVATTINAYRKQIEAICEAELAKALHQLQKGDDPNKVLTQFAHAYTSKLLHHPSVQLRQAGVQGRFDILQLAQQLFLVPEVETA